MTPEDEIIERGLAAASLLSDPYFQSVLKSIAVECFASFTESKPGDREGRENTYNLYQGLQAIEAELNARIHAKDRVVSRLDAEHEAALDAEKYGEDVADEDPIIIIQGNTDR